MTVIVPPSASGDHPVIAASRKPSSTAPILRLIRRPLGAASLLFLVIAVFACIAPNLLSPYDPETADFVNVLSTPTLMHPLGTDSLGRDILARIVHGSAPALVGVLIAVLVASVLAIPVGLASALFRPVDAVVTRVNDLVLSIPGIIVLLMVLALSNDLNWAMVALGILTAPGLIRVVRSAAMSVVEEPYIAAARVFGVGKWKIGFRHVLPRIAGPILVNLSLIAASALITEAGLNFLGLGLKPPTPSWGGLIADGANVINQQPWTLVPAGAIIALAVIAFVLLGDAVRDVTTESWTAGRSKGVTVRGRSAYVAPAPSAHPVAVDPDILLSVRNLGIAFPNHSGGETEVVQGVSFDIRRGEAVGIVGESGCGKTITGLGVLGMLPATAQITSGEVILDGVNVLALSATGRAALRGTSIAFVSQEPMTALDPLFTVGSQIAEAVRTHTGATRAQARARAIELLEQVRINEPERVAKSFAHEISGGMAQRVAIAIALAGSPKLLIADEPTTALDVTVQAEIIALLATLQAETGLSVMLISHDWGVVSAMCSNAVVMYAGQVVERAAVKLILDEPLHPYSEGLLAANPHFAESGQRLATIPGSVPAPADWPTSCHFAERCGYATEACRTTPIELVAVDSGRSSRCIHVDLLRREELPRGTTPKAATKSKAVTR